MNSYEIAAAAFLCIFCGAVSGFLLQGFLPHHHLSSDSKDSVKLGAGLIATMAALILGLLVSSSKGSYDSVNNLINQAAANCIHLDKVLQDYGPEAIPLRQDLRLHTQMIRDSIWPEEIQKKGSAQAFEHDARITGLTDMILSLHPSDERTKQLQNEAVQIATDLSRQHWLVIVTATSKLPVPLVIIPIFWITFLTFAYGIFAPRNATVLASLFFCSLSIGGAIFLICEMSRPLDGSIKVPSQAFQTALGLIGR
jgi:hypothetical protein